jgi:hypothetical protein
MPGWGRTTGVPLGYRIARQIIEAFPWDDAPRYLIRDRDRSYGAVVTRRLRAMGIRDRPITPRSPWQNGHVERLIGSIRRECLGHVVVFGERHFRHLLANYATYYNGVRTHLALDKDTPLHRHQFERRCRKACRLQQRRSRQTVRIKGIAYRTCRQCGKRRGVATRSRACMDLTDVFNIPLILSNTPTERTRLEALGGKAAEKKQALKGAN